MTRSRGISLSAHSVAELLGGLALLVLAFTVEAGTSGMLALFAAGVVLAGLGLGTADSLSLAAHASLDRWLTTGLAFASIALALSDERVASLALLAAAAAQMLLVAVTRWSRPATAR